MNIEEAKKIAASPLGGHLITESHDALRVLADALRAAEGQVAYLNAKLDATHTNRCFNCEQTVTEATTSRQEVAALRAELLSPAPAVAPVNQCDGCRSGAPLESPGRHRQGGTLVACDAARYVAPVAAPKPGPTDDDDVLTARFRAVHERLDAVEMYLRPLGFAGRGGGR